MKEEYKSPAITVLGKIIKDYIGICAYMVIPGIGAEPFDKFPG